MRDEREQSIGGHGKNLSHFGERRRGHGNDGRRGKGRGERAGPRRRAGRRDPPRGGGRRGPLSGDRADFQLGQQQGQLFGIYMKSVLLEVPEFNDKDTRVEWQFAASRAQGTVNDELFIAFA